jgi:hypothetical protein
MDALPGSSGSMSALGDSLMLATEGGPVEAGAQAFGWLGQRQEQAAHLGNRQRKQVRGPPFFTALAWTQVTSR